MRAWAHPGAIWLTAAAAAASIVVAAAPLPARLAGDPGLPPASIDLPEGPADAAVPIEPILALGPFGRPALAIGGDIGSSAELTLHGVVVAEEATSGAIISGSGGKAETYSLGEELPIGARLAEVHIDHVVLESAGRREVLTFPQRHAQPNTEGTIDSGVAALSALVIGAGSAPPEPAASPGDPPAVPPAGPESPGAILAGLRERIADDPQLLLDEHGLAATEAGYRVTDAASQAVRRAGLLPGDVVATVNGQQVGNIEQDRALFDEVEAAGRARMEVVRGKGRIVLSFPLE